MKNFHGICCGVLLGLFLPLASHADGGAKVREQCAGCHAIEKPDYAALGVTERSERKGPPLFYAGDKFNAQWLEAWLVAPKRIRPAGAFPAAHVRPSEQGDVVDPATLSEHPALSAADAAAVTQYLMQLRPFQERIAAQTYQPADVEMRMAQMNFGKFKGCDGCHRHSPDLGGQSGPELYTAWDRLQPAFISAYIADPVFWDPHTLMPRAGLNEKEVHKLVNYLKKVGETKP